MSGCSHMLLDECFCLVSWGFYFLFFVVDVDVVGVGG